MVNNRLVSQRGPERSAGTAARAAARRQASAADDSAGASPSQLRRRPARRAPAREVRIEPARSPEETRLEQLVGGHMPPGKALELRLTDNRYTMITVRRRTDGYGVRVHRMFAAADVRVTRHLARYIVHNDPRASLALGDFIRDNDSVIKDQPRRRRPLKVRTQGKVHDLQKIFDELNEAHFRGKIRARITWGTAPRREGRRRSIKMGSYAVEDRVIRIHPALDNEAVPAYFVAWIVFHEMLHDKHGAVEKGGRRCYHTPAFMAEERSFPEYEKAHAWEKSNIQSLLAG
ncbi:MAG: hypothetical protein KA712_04400 [Myxococcales bacterium]|nr:hypothetical protein [Myxococcales bacterium]